MIHVMISSYKRVILYLTSVSWRYFSPVPITALWSSFLDTTILHISGKKLVGVFLSRVLMLPHLDIPLPCAPTSLSPHVHQFTSLPVQKSPCHTSPITASDVTVSVPLLVTTRRSLLIYTSIPLYVTNWQPVWIVAPPFWIMQYWPFASLAL